MVAEGIVSGGARRAIAGVDGDSMSVKFSNALSGANRGR